MKHTIIVFMFIIGWILFSVLTYVINRKIIKSGEGDPEYTWFAVIANLVLSLFFPIYWIGCALFIIREWALENIKKGPPKWM